MKAGADTSPSPSAPSKDGEPGAGSPSSSPGAASGDRETGLAPSIAFPLPIGHAFRAAGETADHLDHTGADPWEGGQLKQLQEKYLCLWYPQVRPTGVLDVATRIAVTHVQHAMCVEQSGRLDQAVWERAQREIP